MMGLLRLGYFIILVLAAYKVGDRGAGYGVALFIIGALGFIAVVDGPEVLFADGCERYSIYAENC